MNTANAVATDMHHKDGKWALAAIVLEAVEEDSVGELRWRGVSHHGRLCIPGHLHKNQTYLNEYFVNLIEKDWKWACGLQKAEDNIMSTGTATVSSLWRRWQACSSVWQTSTHWRCCQQT